MATEKTIHNGPNDFDVSNCVSPCAFNNMQTTTVINYKRPWHDNMNALIPLFTTTIYYLNATPLQNFWFHFILISIVWFDKTNCNGIRIVNKVLELFLYGVHKWSTVPSSVFAIHVLSWHVTLQNKNTGILNM